MLRRAGRRRAVDARAASIQAALASRQLEAPPLVAAAYGQVVAAAVAVIASLSEQLVVLEAALTQAFSAHQDAAIMRHRQGAPRPMPAPRRSPVPQVCGRWYWPGRSATGG